MVRWSSRTSGITEQSRSSGCAESPSCHSAAASSSADASGSVRNTGVIAGSDDSGFSPGHQATARRLTRRSSHAGRALIHRQGQCRTEQCLGSTGHGPILHPGSKAQPAHGAGGRAMMYNIGAERARPMRNITSHFPFLASAISAIALVSACASPGRPATEISGTPSPTGCNAWFASQGTYSQRNDIRLTLQNRSTNLGCTATKVQLLYASAIRPEGFKVSTPAGWTSREVRCASGQAVCGFEWRAKEAGVLAGQALPGFGLSYIQADQPRPKSWIIDVGRRRVEMPIGTVAG
jgi:hypothetical protein